jgi:hypothetical protein
MKRINHLSHGLGDHVTGHTHPGNIARDGAPKKMHAINVHSGMRTRSKSGYDAMSGHEASAIDSLTGQATVPGSIKSTPGYGNSGVQSGHPLARAPGAKRLTPARPAFGMKSETDLHELGRAVLAQAIKN